MYTPPVPGTVLYVLAELNDQPSREELLNDLRKIMGHLEIYMSAISTKPGSTASTEATYKVGWLLNDGTNPTESDCELLKVDCGCYAVAHDLSGLALMIGDQITFLSDASPNSSQVEEALPTTNSSKDIALSSLLECGNLIGEICNPNYQDMAGWVLGFRRPHYHEYDEHGFFEYRLAGRYAPDSGDDFADINFPEWPIGKLNRSEDSQHFEALEKMSPEDLVAVDFEWIYHMIRRMYWKVLDTANHPTAIFTEPIKQQTKIENRLPRYGLRTYAPGAAEGEDRRGQLWAFGVMKVWEKAGIWNFEKLYKGLKGKK